MERGLFITLEGADGVGKTTQFEMLAQALEKRGIEVCTLHEPGGTRVGEKIRALLLDAELDEMDPLAELMLFEAARAQIVAQVIRPKLAQGAIVVCDRFADSTVAYQGYGRGIGADICRSLNAISTAGIEPDLTVLLTLDQREAKRRVEGRTEDGATDRMERAGADFFAHVAEGFSEIAACEPERVKLVSAAGSAEEVHQRVLAAVDAAMADRGIAQS